MAYRKNIDQYKRQAAPIPGNPRYNEAWALLEAARRIAGVVQFGDLTTPTDKRKLRDAVRLNLRIWTIIQAEQATGEDMLPPEIRQNILTLCRFIDRHTMAVMVNPTPEAAATLININRHIASGLLGRPDESDQPAPADAAAAPLLPEGAARIVANAGGGEPAPAKTEAKRPQSVLDALKINI